MMLRNSFLFLLFLFFFEAAGQQKDNSRFRNLSDAEKKWARRHPFTALKVKRLTKEALLVVAEVKRENLLDQYDNGGKLDAFRHAFTMAYLAQRVSVKKLRDLGIAHEKANYDQFMERSVEHGETPDSLSGEMDLRNNELGFSLGLNNKNIQTDSLKMVVIKAISNGEAWCMRRNQKGKYVNCKGEEIDPAEWKGKWSVPKCLVRSHQ